MKTNYLKIFVPFIAFSLYLLLAVFTLMYGHPHEDAYILFIYSENLASGNGIRYYPGAAPAEGATDFLWMLLLAQLYYLGIDIALSAAFLNAIGIAICAFLIQKLILEYSHSGIAWACSAVLVALLVISNISVASIAGFSTLFYCALVATLFYLLYRASPKQLLLIPALGIGLGLLRPDGVIIGVSATIIGLYFAANKGLTKPYLYTALVAGAIGTVYFIWRYGYFGNLLPLPLYVKGVDALSLPGLQEHSNWLQDNAFLAVAAAGCLALSPSRSRIFLALLPVCLLFIAMIFATQSQNIAYRFQAPGTILLLLMFAMLCGMFISKCEHSKLPKSLAGGIFAFIAIGVALQAQEQLRSEIDYLTNDDYINFFPYQLSGQLSENTIIALTEAGRLAYWVPGRKYDLVGLNTAETAINKPSPSYISKIDPDMIFIHVADTLNTEQLCQPGERYCELELENIFESVSKQRHWSEINDGVFRAPLAVYAFLQETETRYKAIAVLYQEKFNHLYFIKEKSAISYTHFLDALARSFDPAFQKSYLNMKRLEKYGPVISRPDVTPMR